MEVVTYAVYSRTMDAFGVPYHSLYYPNLTEVQAQQYMRQLRATPTQTYVMAKETKKIEMIGEPLVPMNNAAQGLGFPVPADDFDDFED